MLLLKATASSHPDFNHVPFTVMRIYIYQRASQAFTSSGLHLGFRPSNHVVCPGQNRNRIDCMIIIIIIILF